MNYMFVHGFKFDHTLRPVIELKRFKMDDLLNKVEQMQVSMDMIDGFNDTAKGRVDDMEKRLKIASEKVKTAHELLEKYNDLLEYKKGLDKKFDVAKKTLLYIHKYFPEGLVTLSEAGPENVEPPTVVKKSQEYLNSSTRNPPQSAKKPKPNQTPRKVLAEESNIQARNASHSYLNIPSITFSASKNPEPKPRAENKNPAQGISIDPVSAEEFNCISSYMKGRLTLAEINGFVDIYNSTLNKKYDLIKRPKKAKSKVELEQSLVWKEQEVGELVGALFCTSDDFDKLSSIKIGSKKILNIITILRHLKRIKEVRNLKTLYYVACF